MSQSGFPFSKVLIFLFLMGTVIFAGLLLQVINQLPEIEGFSSYVPAEATILYSAEEKIIARFHREENRQVVPLSKISLYFPKAVIAVEDPHFWQHHGFDFTRILRAFIKNLIYGRILEGGSTITQQLARNLFLSRKRTLARKLGEIVLALQLEKRYTKEEILEFYLNQVYLGHNAYGVESAANLYFGKSAKELDLAESTLLAGLIRGPEIYSPYKNFKGAKLRQIFIINKMLEQGIISEREAKLAAIETLNFTPENLISFGEIAPYFTSQVLRELMQKFGEETVYHGGLKVYTTLDVAAQEAAEQVVARFAAEEGKKYNFSQAALVSLDPRSGAVKALLGGVNFRKSQFNRATQAKRQPGSAFKPFVYAAAMEQGISPGTILEDRSTTFAVYPSRWNPEGTWEPKNFDKKFRGPVTVRYALEKSLNVPSIKLLERVGIPSAIEVAQRMGIKSHLEPALSLTLGASEVTLLELTSAYSAFANSGLKVEPHMIIKIENREGAVLYEHKAEEKRVLDPNIAAVMVDLMKGVLTRGTGMRGRIDRPAAAKTGTNEEFKDAWFIGFVPQLVTGIWVGNDDNTSMKGVAEVGVCPRIWKEYNKIVLASEPVLDFPKPEGLKNVKICLSSAKLAGPNCPPKKVKWVTLWEKDVPQTNCDLHQAPESDELEEEGEGEATEEITAEVQ